MKRALLALVGGVALALAGFALAQGTVITLGAEGPNPATVTVTWGDTVTFANQSGFAGKVEVPRATITTADIAPGGTAEVVLTGRGGNYTFRVTGGERPRSGLIVVNAEGTVTLKASAEVVQFGEAATLSGTSTFAGKPVTVQTRAPRVREWSTLAELTAGEDGTFSTTLTPKIGGQFRAVTAGGQVSSESVGIEVEPRLTLKSSRSRVATGTSVTLTVRVKPADAVRQIDLEQFDAQRKRWNRVARKRVRDGVAAFTLKIEEGTTRLRASARRTAVAVGFEAAVSPQTTVKGT